MTLRPRRRWHRVVAVLAVLALTSAVQLAFGRPASAASYVPISGAGSSWSENAIQQWAANVKQYGMTVNYQGVGSTNGRNQFASELIDFGVSEIPYGKDDGAAREGRPPFSYAYMPIVAGGTAFMYNMVIGSKQVTNLRLSGETLAKIFTGGITVWNDAAIKADNPGLDLPARKIVPVVRSDGSGTTAQLTTWLKQQYPSIWDAYCKRAGKSTPCGVTSLYPVVPGSGFIGQADSRSVAGYVAEPKNVGTITYVEYSYARYAKYPVVKMLNKAGYYVEPTASSVAVAMLEARINTDKGSQDYLAQDLSGVYVNADPRTYPLSSYSYMLLPVDKATAKFDAAKGRTLGDFAYYFLCEGQRQADSLGYSPLPVNLVQAGFDQVRRIPGVNAQSIDIKRCNNPTLSADGSNALAKAAQFPDECDKLGVTQCAKGTGGAQAPTAVRNNASGRSSAGASAGASGAGDASGAGTNGASASGAPDGGAAPSAGAAAGAGAVDPDTGQVIGGADSGGTAGGVAALPVSLGTTTSGGLTTALMVLAGLLLIGVTAGPPLVARMMSRGSQR